VRNVKARSHPYPCVGRAASWALINSVNCSTQLARAGEHQRQFSVSVLPLILARVVITDQRSLVITRPLPCSERALYTKQQQTCSSRRVSIKSNKISYIQRLHTSRRSLRRSGSFKVIVTDTNRKPVYNFLLMTNINLYLISRHLPDIGLAQYWSNCRFWQVVLLSNKFVLRNLSEYRHKSIIYY